MSAVTFTDRVAAEEARLAEAPTWSLNLLSELLERELAKAVAASNDDDVNQINATQTAIMNLLDEREVNA